MTTANIFEKSIALSVEITKIGIRKKVQSGRMELKDGQGEQPEADAVSVSKELINCMEFDAIVKRDNTFRSELAAKTLPSPFRKGIYLVPIDSLGEVDQLIEFYIKGRAQLVETFCAVYTQTVLDARNKLGGLWSPSDYLSLDCVKNAFSVSTQYMDLGLPKQLESANVDIYRREREAFNTKLVSASEEIQQALRVSFSELVSHMADRLKPGEDGKPKIFRDSLVENFRDFIGNFKNRNITDDKQLDELISKAKAILNGKNAEALRGSGAYRKEIAEGMDSIKTQLDTMIVAAPSRKFSLED